MHGNLALDLIMCTAPVYPLSLRERVRVRGDKPRFPYVE